MAWSPPWCGLDKWRAVGSKKSRRWDKGACLEEDLKALGEVGAVAVLPEVIALY
jgi:hypothetical protein